MNSFFFHTQAGFQASPFQANAFGGCNPFFQTPSFSAPVCPPMSSPLGAGSLAQANAFWQQLMQIQQNMFQGWQQFCGCPQMPNQGCQPSFGGQNPQVGNCQPQFGGNNGPAVNIHHHYHFHEAPQAAEPAPAPAPAPAPEPAPAPVSTPQPQATQYPPLPKPPLTRTSPIASPPRASQPQALPAAPASPAAVNFKAHAFTLPLRSTGVGGMLLTRGNYALQNPGVASRFG